MNLKEIMQESKFVVLGNTIDESKYAAKIYLELKANNYEVYGVDKEYASLNSVPCDDFILDLCMNPLKAIKLLEENTKNIKAVLIQPGAESDAIKKLLEDKNIEYIEGCALVGLRLYPRG